MTSSLYLSDSWNTKVCQLKNHFSCNDPVTVIIQAILNLKQVYGSNATLIQAECQRLCNYDPPISLGETEHLLDRCTKRGILVAIFANPSSEKTYMVNGAMVQANARNIKYNRPPCQMQDGFWYDPSSPPQYTTTTTTT